MPNFKVILMGQEYTVEAKTRTKAVTEAIARSKVQFPDSSIPSTVLRGLAKTSTIDAMDTLDRESVEKVFSGAK